MPDDLRLRVQVSSAQASFKYLSALATDKERRAWLQTAANDYASRLDVLAAGGTSPPAQPRPLAALPSAQPQASADSADALASFMKAPLELGDLSSKAWSQ